MIDYNLELTNDGVVHFWKINSGQLILSHEGPGRMLNVSFDSDGDKLAATSYSSVNIIPLQYKNLSVSNKWNVFSKTAYFMILKI